MHPHSAMDGAMDPPPEEPVAAACSAQCVDLDLGGELSAARRARAALRGCCEQLSLAAEVCDVVLLLASELVTNAVVHGAAPVHLSAGVQGGFLHLAVSDAGAHHPVVRPQDPSAVGGRGVQLLGALSRAWGVEVRAGGKTVWCRIRTGS